MIKRLAECAALLASVGLVSGCSIDGQGQNDAGGETDGTVNTDSSSNDGGSHDASLADGTVGDGSSIDGTSSDAPALADVTSAVDGSSGDAGSGEAASGDAGGTCTDGVKDGNETGVDCGGSCPACVTYITGTPNTNTKVGNACAPAGASSVSFICPRFMLFSGEMKQAAADDGAAKGWPAGAFNYGVATLDGADCCACYQIVYDAPPNGLGYTPPKPLIIQNFNQGGAPSAFDVFMGKGGEGANTAGCPQLYTSYPSTGEPNSGGITASSIQDCVKTETALASSACVSDVTSACDQIEGNNSYITTTTQTSCIEGNSAESPYHENWTVKARQVECPMALTEVTGCRLNAGNNPQPDPTIQTAAEASGWAGPPGGGSYSTTTMEDCCKPSCAWPGNVTNTMSPWSAMYQCGSDGTPMTN
jgi:hypothetical protein